MTLLSSNGPDGQTVRVRLFGELVRFAGERGYSFDWPLRTGQTVAGLLADIGIPEAEVWMVAVNGVRVPAETMPQAGDEVMVFSPVGGG